MTQIHGVSQDNIITSDSPPAYFGIPNKITFFQSDLDEMANEASLSDDKAKKAMVDAARLADELRSEQEIALSFEKDRKLLDCQLKDMHGRLDEAETNALKGGKKAMNKMETRIR